MQHIVIRKRTEELHAAVEAAASDEEIAKLARVANQASIPPIEYPAETYMQLSKISKGGILCGIQMHLAYARNSVLLLLLHAFPAKRKGASCRKTAVEGCHNPTPC